MLREVVFAFAGLIAACSLHGCHGSEQMLRRLEGETTSRWLKEIKNGEVVKNDKTLADATTPSAEQTNEQQPRSRRTASPQKRTEMTVRITLYQNGFTDDGGEFRSFGGTPDNKKYVEQLKKGYVPKELREKYKNKIIIVALEDRTQEWFKLPTLYYVASHGKMSVKQPSDKIEVAVRITYYQNGFTVDGGEFRAYNTPQNKQFMEYLNKGYLPKELTKKYKEKILGVALEDRTQHPYKPQPPPTYVTYFGTGMSIAATQGIDETVNKAVAEKEKKLMRDNEVTKAKKSEMDVLFPPDAEAAAGNANGMLQDYVAFGALADKPKKMLEEAREAAKDKAT